MADKDDYLSLISSGLYWIVNEVVGQECIVKLRRQTWKVHDIVINSDNYRPLTYITGGSRPEGFDFQSSDVDAMHLDRKSFVMDGAGINQTFLKIKKIPTKLEMETDYVTPGFALVRCVSCDLDNKNVFRCLVLRGNDAYISSRLVRETFLSMSISTQHGPCQQVTVRGYEFDRTFTLKCPFWPQQALPFIKRSLNQGWPSYEVLTDICKDGCLLIPINSKQQLSGDMYDLEWRISFSQAEKRLIHGMNHCQFLCYGLSKLFLNEVLKTVPSVDELVCSYFMKTAVFWEISNGSQDWTTRNFLSKFWSVFRRLINWVSEGYCPNFFIPENNMFKGKIFGGNQRILLSVLRDLYSNGYLCLLRCPSMNKKLSIIKAQPYLALLLPYIGEGYRSTLDQEIQKIQILGNFDSPIFPEEEDRILTILNNTINLDTESEVMKCVVGLRTKYVLQKYAEYLIASSKSLHTNRMIGNKKLYRTMKAAQTIPRRTMTYFTMNYVIYAKCIYMAGNYHKTIEIVQYIKRTLNDQPHMYKWCLDGDIIMSSRQQGMSYDTLIKISMASYVDMHISTSIDEVKLECLAAEEETGGSIFIYPLVFLNFLHFLCYTRLGCYERRRDTLEELRVLICNDDDYRFDVFFKALSWEILGICQQICGDFDSAFQSYMNTLKDENNYFKQATVARIFSLSTL